MSARNAGAIREPILEKPFPSNPGEGKGVDPRTEKLEGLSERFEAHRAAEMAEENAADPGAAQLNNALDSAAKAGKPAPAEDKTAELQSADDVADQISDSLQDGAASIGDLHEDGAAQPTQALPDYIEIRDGKPVMRLKVDGADDYIDLDDAKKIAQKSEAADRRFRSAEKWSRDLQRREAELAERQNQSAAATPSASTPSPLPEQTDAAGLDIEATSKDLVSSILMGTEEEAAEKLVQFAEEVRNSVTPTATIDQAQLVREAKAAAKEELDERQLASAYASFREEFSDIVGNSEALAYADYRTTRVARENPALSPSEVLTRVGEETRSVIFQKQKPGENDVDPEPKPEVVSERQKSKEQLRPIPVVQTTVQQKDVEQNQAQTPQEVLAEMRKARNQPV